MAASKGAVCKAVRIKERGRNVFVKLNNCKFDKNFAKSKNNSVVSKKYVIQVGNSS